MPRDHKQLWLAEFFTGVSPRPCSYWEFTADDEADAVDRARRKYKHLLELGYNYDYMNLKPKYHITINRVQVES